MTTAGTVTNGASSAASSGCELTILMPCLDEAETIETCVRKARGYLDSRGICGEVLIADNGSTDGSPALANDAGARVIAVAERGYGAALQAGIAAARGRYVVMGDADDSYDFSDLDAFVAQLRSGAQLVMGNRFRGGIVDGAMPALHRYLGNPVLSFIGRLLFRSSIGDFHCGLRAFDRDAIGELDLKTTGMEFASEMVVRSTLARLRIAEVPTVLHPDGRSRPPHLRSWRDGWRHLRFLLLYSPRWLFWYPGIIATVVGLVGMLVLGSAAWTPGRGRFSEALLIASGGLVVVGVQALQFAVLARDFAATQGLLPRISARTTRLRSRVTLELALLAALVLGIASLVMLATSLAIAPHSDPTATTATAALRLGAIAVTTGVVSVQVALGGWLLSLLELPRRTPAHAAVPR